MALKLEDLVERFGGVVSGNAQCIVTAVATLSNAGAGDITFVVNARYRRLLASTSAAVVIIREKDQELCRGTAWIVNDPYTIYARVAQLLYPLSTVTAGIHSSASIDDSAEIAAEVNIAAHCVIGPDVRIDSQVSIGAGSVIESACQIGANCRLSAHVVLYPNTQLGERVILHAGVVLGADGFGFANDNGEWLKIPQMGRVIIGDDVEIGANTTVDRGTLDNTVLENGVKLDNQIQVGHNVTIGSHTAIAAGTGIAGSTRIGARCAIGGYVGINGHLTIVDDVQITGKSFVTGSISEPGVYSSGYPLESNRKWLRNVVRLHQLDDMARRLRRVEREIKDT